MSLLTTRSGHLPWASHRKEAQPCLSLWSMPEEARGPGSQKTHSVDKIVSLESFHSGQTVGPGHLVHWASFKKSAFPPEKVKNNKRLSV